MISKYFSILAGCLLICSVFNVASADTISFRQGETNALFPSGSGYQGNDDLEIQNQSTSQYNFGGGNPLEVGAASQTSTKLCTSIARWDISAMSTLAGTGQNVVVTSATLWFKLRTFYAVPAEGMKIYAILPANAGWVEGTTAGAPATSGQACWDYKAYNTTFWAGSAGLTTLGVDIATTPFATVMPSNSDGTPEYLTITLPTAIVQGWIDNPAANAGYLLQASNDLIGTSRPILLYYGSEATLAERPKLTIAYTAATPQCGDNGYFAGDISGPAGKSDCHVNFYDFAAMAAGWLECSDPAVPACDQYWR